MVRRTAVLSLLLVLLASCLAAGAAAEKSKPAKEDYYQLYAILVDAMDHVERNYVKEVDRRKLMEAAIRGVLSELDPYSAYIEPEQMSTFRRAVDSEFGGIGIQISVEGGKLQILSPMVGTPAYRAGLLPGDRIVEIDGKSTDGVTLEEAVRRLKGEAGTKVKLTVIHPGSSEEVKVEIAREVIHIDTALGDHRKQDGTWDFMLKPKEHIGYVRLTAFSRDTAGELRAALEELRSAGMRGLILDLRFNPGGLLGSAIEVSDLFISQGRIVSTKGRNTPEQLWDAHPEGTFEGFPMVVLVNRYSASGSEIVSACLQDHGRAVIMGERTWGKGSVQNVIELGAGVGGENPRSALKLTTASYRRPNGKNIHRFPDSKNKDDWGVMPDKGFRLKLSDSEMLALVLDRRSRDIVLPSKAEQPKPGASDEEPSEKPQEGPAAQPAEAPGEQPAKEPAAAGAAEQPQAKPAEQGSPRGEQAPEEKAAGEKPEKTPAEESQKPAFVDRQLQMAVEYLLGKLAEAKQAPTGVEAGSG